MNGPAADPVGEAMLDRRRSFRLGEGSVNRCGAKHGLMACLMQMQRIDAIAGRRRGTPSDAPSSRGQRTLMAPFCVKTLWGAEF